MERAIQGNEEGTDLFEQVFQAMPSPAFIVDADMRLLRWNRAATELMGTGSATPLKRGGDVLHCINSFNADGCGHSAACQRCVIRNSVTESRRGTPVRKKTAKMTIQREGEQPYEASFLVTAAPIDFHEEHLTLLILEDISELLQLRSLLPICASCKKIRDDQDYWHSLEEYLGKQLDISFSHGICPDCLKKEYPHLYEGVMAKLRKDT